MAKLPEFRRGKKLLDFDLIEIASDIPCQTILPYEAIEKNRISLIGEHELKLVEEIILQQVILLKGFICHGKYKK